MRAFYNRINLFLFESKQVESLGRANDKLAQESKDLTGQLTSIREEMTRKNEELEKATAKLAVAEDSATTNMAELGKNVELRARNAFLEKELKKFNEKYGEIVKKTIKTTGNY